MIRYHGRSPFECEPTAWPFKSFKRASQINLHKITKRSLAERNPRDHVSFSSTEETFYEVCYDWRRSCCSCRICNAGGCTAGRHQPRILRAVLSKCKLPELRSWQSVHRKLPSRLARWRLVRGNASLVAKSTVPPSHAPHALRGTHRGNAAALSAVDIGQKAALKRCLVRRSLHVFKRAHCRNDTICKIGLWDEKCVRRHERGAAFPAVIIIWTGGQRSRRQAASLSPSIEPGMSMSVKTKRISERDSRISIAARRYGLGVPCSQPFPGRL
jgi:hypothetical protein